MSIARILATGLLVILLLLFSDSETFAQEALPADVWRLNDQVEFPDWSRTSFSDLAPVDRGGSISDEFNNSLGYDLSRSWQAGDTPDEIFKLGDLTDTLGAEKLSLKQISELTGLKIEDIKIADFPLLANQSLEQLRNTIPFLENFKIADIPPIDEVLAAAGRDLIDRQIRKSLGDRKLGEVLDQHPLLGELRLNQIDLKDFNITHILHLTG